jgi:hypothetical protein
MQCVLKTSDGGRSWQEVSPDLTGYVEKPEKPGEAKLSAGPPPPAITTLALSPVEAGEIWVGTSNRLIQLTQDGGKNWQNVTPPALQEPQEIFYVEASHHDAATAYLTVGARRESIAPLVFRTHDYGKSWQKIVNGFPKDEMVRVVREDPVRKGLLYAGTDTTVFVSWDDGGHWQPLTLNLPPAPITDLTVHGNDLAISTFGRSLWILDDVTPLRKIDTPIADEKVYLFPPASGMRVRWDNYEDTPYPRETPAGENPPDGAVLDYFLKNAASGELTLTIYDDKGAEVGSFSSAPKPFNFLPANAPEYWFAPPTKLPSAAGVNRFAWNLRYPPPLTLPYGYYGELLGYTEYTMADHAVPGLTPRSQPQGPFVVPGNYTVELRYAGQTLRQTLTIELDSRVQASQAALVAQRDLALAITRGMKTSYDSYYQVAALRDALAERRKSMNSKELKKLQRAIDSMSKEIDAAQDGVRSAPGFGPVNRDLARLLFSVESADMRPADTIRSAAQETCGGLDKDLALWSEINGKDVPAFNVKLRGKATALPVTTVSMGGCQE